MIVTLTPNPGIDRTVTVPRLQYGVVNRATSTRIEPGGKGVNVSRALAANGSPTVAVLPVGGPEGALLTQLLGEAAVPHQAVGVLGGLRVNLAVVEPDGTTTKVNEPGPDLRREEVERLLSVTVNRARTGDWVVGCGSLPPSAPPDLYAQLVERARARGAQVAIDTSGPALVAALKAEPDLIKPNNEELSELVEAPLPTLRHVVEAAQQVVAQGIATVLVSLGADGAVLVTADLWVHAVAAVRTPQSSVGAGDCLLAGYLDAVSSKREPVEALELGVAWGAAAVALPGSDVPGPSEVARVQVQINRVPDPARRVDGARAPKPSHSW